MVSFEAFFGGSTFVNVPSGGVDLPWNHERGRVWKITPVSAIRDVRLPNLDYMELPTGGPLYLLGNFGSFDIRIKKSGGALLVQITPQELAIMATFVEESGGSAITGRAWHWQVFPAILP